MRAKRDFSPIAPDEVQDLGIDFVDYLQPGDSISSVVAWHCTVQPQSTADDPTPQSRLQGSPQQVGTVIVQTVGTCVADVVYAMEAVVMTALGETLSIWAPISCQPVG